MQPSNTQQFKIKRLARFISSATLGLIIAPGVMADEDVKTSDEPIKTLNRVVVTADAEESSSKMNYLIQEHTTGALGNRSVLDTPFSITQVDSEEIIERGAKSIGQIFVNDASVYAPTPSSQTDWWGTQIRGLPVRNFYIDDVPMLLYWGGDFPAEAADNITALKGLTGFMYGFGEPGGAISYQLKKPTDEPETFLNLGYRNPGLLSAHVDSSHNFGDEFGLRANVLSEQGTAYNQSETDRNLITLALDKNFGESVNWLTHVVYEKKRIEGEPIQFYLSDYDVVGSGNLPKVNYDYDDFNIDNSYYDTETFFASSNLEWQLADAWSVGYKSGFSRKSHQSNKSFADLLNQAGDYRGYAYNFAGKLDNFFNQLMLQGMVATGDIVHELVIGTGLQTSKERWGTEWYWENDFNGNIHQEQTFRISRTPDFSLESKPSLESDQTYAFASDTLHLNDNWQTILGFRFTDYELKNSGFNTRETSPTLAIIYQPNEYTRFYGSYVEGLEPGSRVGPDYANAGQILDATVSKQFETGIKIANGDFNYTAAIFKIERTSQIDVMRGDDRYLLQDGLETYEGIELATAYQFTPSLNLGLSAIYLDGTLEQVSVDNAALEGNDPAYAANVQLVGNVEYQFASVQGLKLQGNIRYFGESYTSITNNLKIPAYTLVNTGISYQLDIQDRAWIINANINNLLNKKYWTGSGWSSGNMGEARNLSLAINTFF
jgi:iron complex outermembrane recepter protein